MGEATEKDEDEKLVPVGPGAEGLSKPGDLEREEIEDSRLAASEDEDELEHGQASDGSRKRESAKERRDRAKKARERERLELNFYAKRNEELEKRLMQLENRTTQHEGVALDQRITSVKAQMVNADRVLAEALKRPNGAGAEEFTETLRIREELRDQLAQLSATKQTVESRAKAQEPSSRSPAPDPLVIRNAREWADRHEWFDFNGNDEDSRVVRAIDEALAAEGFNPAKRDYWDELTDRVKRRLPERFNGARSRTEDVDDIDESSSKPRANTGPKFSSGGRERPLKKGEVYVSAERKAAMQQYGVWDDPVARARLLKKYAQWDAEVAASNRS